MTKTSFLYKGIVNLQLKINNKIINFKAHNNGTDFMKQLFAKLLCGYNSEFFLPAYLDLRKSSDNGLTWVESLMQYSPVSGGSYFLENNEWVAQFQASIPYESILGGAISPSDTNLYRLYMLSKLDTSTSEYHDLVFVPISVSALSYIVSGTAGLITWEMSLLDLQEEN